MPSAQRNRKKLPIPIYPAVFVALVCVHAWAFSGVSPLAATRSLAVGLLVAVVVLAASRIVIRDRDAAGVVALMLLLALLVGAHPLGLILTLSAASFVVVERVLYGATRIDWRRVGQTLVVFVAVLASAVLVEAVQLGRLGDLATAVTSGFADATTQGRTPVGSAPDVYVILLDGYARHDVLEERFGLDDAAFLDGLVARGFSVADASHSNYLSTNPSLASFLNFRHLADIPALDPVLDDPSAPEGPPVHRAISRPAVIDEFSALGYETIAIASGFNQASVRGADQFIDTGQISSFEIALLRTSPVPPAITAIAPDAFSGSQRDRIEEIFQSIEGLAAASATAPRFVFAHVPSPHAPWVHNADGSAATVTDLAGWYVDVPGIRGLTRDRVIRGYSGEVVYIGARTLETIDVILAASKRPPIILVLSDHGSFFDVQPQDAEVRLRNLFAAYTPEAPGLFPRDVTLVEVFPILFEAYFRIPLEKADGSLYVAGPRGLYDLVQVVGGHAPVD